MALTIRSQVIDPLRIGARMVIEKSKRKREELENEEIDDIFEPVIEILEKKTEEKVQKAVEEERVKIREEKEIEEEQEEMDRIRAERSEKVKLIVNGKKTIQSYGDIYKSVKPVHMVKKVKVNLPEYISSSENENESENERDEEDYYQTVKIKIDERYEHLLQSCNSSDLVDHIIEMNFSTIDDILTDFEKLKESGVGSSYHMRPLEKLLLFIKERTQ